MLHDLKIWPQYFAAVIDGTKTWELRKGDRNYMVGDNLLLREWSPHTQEYSGQQCLCRVLGVWDGLASMTDDYVLMSIVTEARDNTAYLLTMAAGLMDEASKMLQAIGPEVLESIPAHRWPLADELGGAASLCRDALGPKPAGG